MASATRKIANTRVAVRFIADKFPSRTRHIQALASFETVLHRGLRLVAFRFFFSPGDFNA
jgi:hypothetical protein